MPLDKKNLTDPSNRRISIVVLNAETVQRLKQDGTEDPAKAAGTEPETGVPVAAPGTAAAKAAGPAADAAKPAAASHH